MRKNWVALHQATLHLWVAGGKAGRFDVKAMFVLLCLASPAAAQDLLFFQSPTGNIHCLIATGDYAGARCDMRQLTPTYRTAPPDCDLDWGSSFEIAAQGRKGALACVGDSVEDPGSFVLGYGKSVTLGGFVCSSEKSGMTCTNPAGHGFTLSKAKQRLF